MNVARMRLLDRLLGVPACWLLTQVRRLFDWRAPTGPVRRVLFIKLAEMGSTVLARAALARAIEQVGRENVYFLLFAENRPILDLLDMLPPENIIAIDAKGIAGAVVGALRAIFRLRALGIDAVVDLEFFARSSAALAYLSGARLRSGYHGSHGAGSYRGDLLTHRVGFNPYLHTSRTFQLLVEALAQPARELPTIPQRGWPEPTALARFTARPDDTTAVRTLLAEVLPGRGRLVLLNANASDLMPLRRWPSERYVELAKRLLATEADVRIGFTGAPSEAAAVESLVAQVGSPRCASLAGRTTLRQLLTVYTEAEVLVTNDSGPAHFAALTPIDVVVLFGPETPKLFAADSPRTLPVWAALPCSPCINAFNDRQSACRDNACMTQIGIEQVLGHVRDRLQERAGGRRRLPLAG